MRECCDHGILVALSLWGGDTVPTALTAASILIMKKLKTNVNQAGEACRLVLEETL